MAEYYGNICTCRKCNGIVHTIRRGDTLYLLSRYYNVTINEIMRANANVNIYNLQIGDQICIPVRRPAPTNQGQMQGQNQGQNQGQMQGQNQGMQQRPQNPPMAQPRSNESNESNERRDNLGELLEDLFERREENERMRSEGMEETGAETESEEVSAQAMDDRRADVMESQGGCCGGMKVRDVLKNENMTMEELARMLKDMK